MAADYFVLAFVGAVGVYQIAAAHAGFRGLGFFRHPVVQYLFGLLIIGGAFGWFYGTGDRNWQHNVEGTQQLGLFLLAIILAYFATAIVASLIHARMTWSRNQVIEGRQHDRGFETLKTTTFLGGILSSLRKRRQKQ
jgi:hypothetical protein